jgi:hypothetical protein
MWDVREKIEMHTDFWRRNLDGKAICKTLAWEHNIKRLFRKYDGVVWIGLIWLGKDRYKCRAVVHGAINCGLP